MKSPLVDVLAILMCILLVVLVGQYYIHKKAAENVVIEYPKVTDNKVLQKSEPTMFEQAVKVTE